MKKVKKKTPYVWVSKRKNRLPSAGQNGDEADYYYLNDGEEFVFEIFNPTKSTYKVLIKIQGEVVTGGGIIIRNGERVWLDCNVSTHKKFVFRTYEVENSDEVKEAISENGEIEVFFYEEYIDYWKNDLWLNNIWYHGFPKVNHDIGQQWYYGNPTCQNLVLSKSDINTKSVLRSKDILSSDSPNIETGKIESGDFSSQEFNPVEMKFVAVHSYYQQIKILPYSLALVNQSFIGRLYNSHSEDNGSDFLFCTNCGNKYNIKHNYCNKCGSKL